jgi:hypothetical protein
MTRGRRLVPKGSEARGRKEERGRRAVCEDGRTVDALAITADEGRGHAAKRPGEVLATGDPGDSEWGNPPGDWPGAALKKCAAGTGGTETSQYPEEKRGFPE